MIGKTNTIQQFQNEMRKKRLQPKPQAEQKIELAKSMYAKKDDLNELRQAILNMLARVEYRLDTMESSVSETFIKTRKFTKKNSRIQSEAVYSSLFNKLKEARSELLGQIDEIKLDHKSQMGKILPKINFPVQRSVSIPVKVNQGGTGSTSKAAAVANLLVFKKDKFTATGGESEYTLTATPIENAETIYLNGILMEQTVEYSISGTTLTLVTTPANGDKIEAHYSSVNS